MKKSFSAGAEKKFAIARARARRLQGDGYS